MVETGGGFVAYRHNKVVAKQVSHGGRFFRWWVQNEYGRKGGVVVWRRNRVIKVWRRHLTLAHKEETLLVRLNTNAIFSVFRWV